MLGALVLAALFLGAWESLLRGAGHRPTVTDDAALWASARDRARGDAVVLVGASRMQLGVAPEIVAELAPDRGVAMLASLASSPLPTLDALAGDPGFHGVVLCSFGAWHLTPTHPGLERQAELLAYHADGWTPCMRAERELDSLLQERLCFASRRVNGRAVVARLVRSRSLPTPDFRVTQRDRGQRASFDLLDLARYSERAAAGRREDMASASHVDPERWQAALSRIQRSVRLITGRGGQVVFIKMPLAGAYRAVDEAQYPRKAYWDRLAALEGLRTLHADDVPALRAFTPADGSHLDARDRGPFTRALMAHLLEIGAFEPRK